VTLSEALVDVLAHVVPAPFAVSTHDGAVYITRPGVAWMGASHVESLREMCRERKSLPSRSSRHDCIASEGWRARPFDCAQGSGLTLWSAFAKAPARQPSHGLPSRSSRKRFWEA
jgi:hypothetical protein